jgi:uncharacterized peroxidase-related enzyme
MAWIETVEVERATGRLRKLYDQVKTADGHVDNILKVHSLRPATLLGHLSIYKAAMHSKPSALSPRERELVGVVVSQLNGCEYCVRHHRAGLARHLGDAELAEELSRAAVGESDSTVLDDRERAMCDYAAKLTTRPQSMDPSDLDPLRRAGLDDAGILDVNQVASYFAYANRTVQGLGVTADGEPLGLHPDEDREGFGHG